MRNVRAHAVSRVVEVVVRALLLPYVLAHLPRETYGAWAWVLSIAGYLSLADLGLGQGNVSGLSRALHEGDADRASRIVSATLWIHTGTLAVAMGVMLAVGLTYEPAPVSEAPPVGILLALLLSANGVALLGNPFGSVLHALQRFDILRYILLVRLALQVLGTVIVLELGLGVAGLAWLQIGLSLFHSGARVWIATRRVNGLRVTWAQPADMIRRVPDGAPLLILSLAGTVAHGFERTALGFFADFTFVAQYAVALRLVELVRQIPQVVIFSMIPASAALAAAGDGVALEKLHAGGFRFAAVMVLGLVALLLVCARPALEAWVGPGFGVAARLVSPLSLGILVTALCSPGTNVLIGSGRLRERNGLFASWIGALIAIDVLALAMWGQMVAGWAPLVVNVGMTVVFLRSFPSGQTVLPLLPGILIAIFLGTAAVSGADAALGDGRLAALAVTLAGATVVAVIFGAWSRVVGFVSAGELRMFREAIMPGRRGRLEDDPTILMER